MRNRIISCTTKQKETMKNCNWCDGEVPEPHNGSDDEEWNRWNDNTCSGTCRMGLNSQYDKDISGVGSVYSGDFIDNA